MCKDHDEQHYPREIREAAMVVAGGSAVDRDMMLRALVHDGMVAFLEVEADCMPGKDLEAAVSLVKRHWRKFSRPIADLKLRVHERWDTKLEQMIEEFKANQVD